MKIILIGLLIFFINCYHNDAKKEYKKWDNSTIYYSFDSSIELHNKEKIKKCMDRISSNSNVIFIDCDKENIEYKNKLIIYHNGTSYKNHSSIGYNNSPYIYLSIYFDYLIVHELLHVLGFTHEHQRPDRDNYVTVLWDNIIPSSKSNFEIKDNNLIDYKEYEYDYKSIMHYSYFQCSKNGQQTLSFNTDEYIDNEELSVTDIKKINDLYK